MLSGKWIMKVDTPLGKMDLLMEVEEKEGIVTGTCNFNKHDGEITGTIEKDTFQLTTALPTPFGKTKFKITGQVNDDSITGKARAGALGSFGFEGNREQ